MTGQLTGPIATLASTVYERMRREIVRGALPPGAKLRIETLRDRYGVGGTPIREALNRLSAEGLVVQKDQKGFQVASISLDELDELSRTRCSINEIALTDSIANGDVAWEENIVLAFHRLSRLPNDLNAPAEVVTRREQLHRAFHFSLIAACRSRWLRSFAEMLFDCADRYRFVTRAFNQDSSGSRDTGAEHGLIMEATINRDAPAAIKLLNNHLLRTAELIARSVAAFGPAPSPPRMRLPPSSVAVTAPMPSGPGRQSEDPPT
jgi:GntR family transcriptional regulator, carbon starvation induced regulator